MIRDEITERLFAMRDEAYRDFQSKLIPTVAKEDFIGVRTPDLRNFAKEIAKRSDREAFLDSLPHRYFDEYQLHAFTISLEKDFEKCIAQIDRLMPYVDNWAVCDQMNPACFKKHRAELRKSIEKWLKSERTYTVRFALKLMMNHFLDEDFDPDYAAKAAAIRSEEYYVNMMRAWYFATALSKQYEAALPFLTEHRLDIWTHNKTIQKAVESNRIPAETKKYLKTLKRTG